MGETGCMSIVRLCQRTPSLYIQSTLPQTQARSQHVSQFRGARRTGVHYLRKNMWASDRPLLYLRDT